MKGGKFDFKELEDFAKKVKDLSKSKQVSFDNLFNNCLMSKYTNFKNLDDLFEKYNILTEQEEFENYSEDKLDKIVANETKFSSWEEMLNTAGEEYISRQLGL